MMRWKRALVAHVCALLAVPAAAWAGDPDTELDSDQDAAGAAVEMESSGGGGADATVESSADHSVFSNYSIRLGVESAGPILFRDTPDARLEDTSVFQYGGRVAFLFGNELTDNHRFGLGVSYNFVAKSPTRKLHFTDIYAIYETGHPLVLQAALGADIASGTSEFADQYGGVYSSLALRYSFVSASRFSKISVSPGVVAKSYLVTADAQMSSFFVGAQLEFSYNTNK